MNEIDDCALMSGIWEQYSKSEESKSQSYWIWKTEQFNK